MTINAVYLGDGKRDHVIRREIAEPMWIEFVTTTGTIRVDLGDAKINVYTSDGRLVIEPETANTVRVSIASIGSAQTKNSNRL